MFRMESSATWYPIHSGTRTEHMKKVKISDVYYSYRNIGLGLWKEEKRIFSSADMPLRIINEYLGQIHNAITIEVDFSHYKITRSEFMFLDWLSAVGGLGSIAFVVLKKLGDMVDT